MIYQQFINLSLFCGQQGCPAGIESPGTVGAFFALCVKDQRKWGSEWKKH